MKRILTFVVLALLTAPVVVPALAQDVVVRREGPVEAAARALLSSDPAARDAARAQLAAEPGGAVTVLMQLVEELRVERAGQEPTLATLDDVGDVYRGSGDVLQLYDVRDLVARESDPEALLERLRGVGDGAVVRINEASPGVLIVTTAAKVHEALQAKLDDLRADLAPMAMIEVRFVEADRMQDLGLDLVGQRPGSVVLGTEVLEQITAWQAAGRADIVSAPKLIAVMYQRANVTIGREISYVADFEVEVGQSTFICDPIIETAFDGTSLDLTVHPAVEGRCFVDFEYRVSDVREPFETFRTEIGGGTPVEIQLLDVYETRLKRGLDVADGGAVLITLPGPPDTVRLMALSVRTVDLPVHDDDGR